MSTHDNDRPNGDGARPIRMQEAGGLLSLARRHRAMNRGTPKRAMEVLAPVFNGFTEGHDTGDLVEAGDLLQALA